MYIGLISFNPSRSGIRSSNGFHWLGAFKGFSPSTSAVVAPSTRHCLTASKNVLI